MNTQGWSPLRWTGWISLQSKRLSRVFSNTTVQQHQFFCTQPSPMGQLSHRYMTTGKTLQRSSLGLLMWHLGGVPRASLGLGTGTSSLLSHSVGQSRSQAQPRLSGGKTDFTLSWWGRLESVTKGHEYRKESRLVTMFAVCHRALRKQGGCEQ